MRKFSKGEEEAEINMTPMLDIVFIMLIFFIVTASFLRETGLEVYKPEPTPEDPNPPPPDPDNKPILFKVDNSSRVIYALRPIDVGSARAIIEREYAARPHVPVIIAAEPEANTGIVIQIYDMAEQAEVKDIKCRAPNTCGAHSRK